MKYLPFFILLMVISVFACRKESSDNTCVAVANFVTNDDNNFDYTADEAAFLADDTEGDNDPENAYNPEAEATMKILYVTSLDSLPYWKPSSTTKKQKYGRRQIVQTTQKTQFRLTGFGFKTKSDTSRVEAIIAKTRDTLSHNCEIVSWSNDTIVLNVPTLTIQTAIDKVFSLKFKVFRSNDKPNKAAVSRTKSRGCISDITASSVYGNPVCSNCPTYADSLLIRIKARRVSYGLSPMPTGSAIILPPTNLSISSLAVGTMVQSVEGANKAIIIGAPTNTGNDANGQATYTIPVYNGDVESVAILKRYRDLTNALDGYRYHIYGTTYYTHYYQN